MLKAFVKLIKALSSNTAPGEIAHAFAWGVILGFMPKDNALWYILFIFIFFMRIQRGVMTITMLIVSLFAGIADPFFNEVGYWILSHPAMQSPMTTLINTPFVAFTKINNTIVMGCLACSAAAYIPLYIISRVLTWIWRKYLGAALKNLKVVKMIGNVPLVQKIADFMQGDF
ncbi:MAG: TIGR03546 family protein [Treponema sp.]|nr:TIGR03546 family protein [Treponema sp.]